MKVAFYRGRKTLFSHLIYFHQRLRGLEKKHAIYTHVELLFEDGWMFSSSEVDGGVRGKYMAKFKDHWDFVETKLTKKDEKSLRDWCEMRANMKTPYDWFGIFFTQILRTGWFKKDYKDFCSEFCTLGLQGIYNKKVNGVDATFVSPGDLHKLLSL